MNTKLFLAPALLAISVLIGLPSAQASSLFGQFVGSLEHEKLGREQLAKLDLIVSRTNQSSLDLKAVLTLHFGGFDSGEYVSYHFDDVEYNLLTNTLTFDQADQGISLTTESFQNGRLVGKLRSLFSGDVGKLRLTRGGRANPKLPLIQALGGEYQGSCDGKASALQVLTYRATGDTFQVGNPFGAYELKAQLGEENAVICPARARNPDPRCVKAIFDEASYNFFTGQLSMVGYPLSLNCKVSGDRLDCGKCVLSRTSSESENPRLAPIKTDAAFSAFSNDGPALQDGLVGLDGEYSGYVHHEYLNRYQVAKLNLMTYQSTDSNGQQTLKIAAMANLFFGGENSPEMLSYRYDTVEYSNPLLSPQFVLSREDADVDAILKIESIKNGVIKGVWHSRTFGRVGAFELRKGKLAKLPASASIMESVSAVYQNADWEIELIAALGQAPVSSNNPFYPLHLGGYVQMKKFSAKEPITGGSYDFFTGRISLLRQGEEIFQGTRKSQAEFVLRKTSVPMGFMQSFEPVRFSVKK